MNKAYSHFTALAFAAMAFSSCSRADYATHPTATPLTEASVAQAPTKSPAAEMSAQVTTPLPAETIARTAPQPTTPVARPVAAAPAPAAPVARPAVVAATASQPAAQAAKPSLAQHLLLKKVAKQLAKADSRHQNTASTEQTAARGGSLTILLVGLVILLVGILIGAGWLTTVGSIIALVGLILLLLKAL